VPTCSTWKENTPAVCAAVCSTYCLPRPVAWSRGRAAVHVGTLLLQGPGRLVGRRLIFVEINQIANVWTVVVVALQVELCSVAG
jgi:hypothetical protein